MKPRLVRLFVIMVALVAAFVWLGNWQWQTAHNKANQKVLEHTSKQSRQPLDSVLKPQTAFDNSTSLQPVSVTGRYDDAKTELVAGRVLAGKHGWWVMTPLVVDGTGARLPIVRGFVERTNGIPKPPSGTVTIEGALAPGESVSTLGDLPKGQIGTIDMGLLLNDWGGSVYNAFIFSTKQTPATAVAPGETSLQQIPPPVPKTTKIEWRNAAYAVQWWVFAAFAVFMWIKILREEHQADAAKAADDEAHVSREATETAKPGTVDRHGASQPRTSTTDDSASQTTSPHEGKREDTP